MFKNHLRIWSSLPLIIAILGMRCKSSNTPSFDFDEESVRQHINYLASSPHPLGSERQKQVFEYIKAHLEKQLGLEVYEQIFQIEVPNPVLLSNPTSPSPLTLEKTARNIFTYAFNQNQSCLILLGSHYDSKLTTDFNYHGANDSASSSAALLNFARAFQKMEAASMPSCDIGLVWFDAEEAYLENWNDGLEKHPAKIQDNTYGSRHFSKQLEKCEAYYCLTIDGNKRQVKALILLDMIGSNDITLTPDSNSSTQLLRRAQQLAPSISPPIKFANRMPRPIEDDHVPFRELGIEAINLIDFENTRYWHRPGDEPDQLSMKSIEAASRLAFALLLDIAPPEG